MCACVRLPVCGCLCGCLCVRACVSLTHTHTHSLSVCMLACVCACVCACLYVRACARMREVLFFFELQTCSAVSVLALLRNAPSSGFNFRW